MFAKSLLAAALAAITIWPAAIDACSEPQTSTDLPSTVEAWASGAKLLDGLGERHRAISSTVPRARAFFDQGLRLLWAFNHDEATRSFAAAAQADPNCAICYWGVALTVGPNYNLPLLAPQRAKVAWQALEAARAVSNHASPMELELIDALGARYKSDAALAGPALTAAARAYADVMQVLAWRHPDDADVQALAAEALMNISPWKLWSADGAPAPETPRIVSLLERVLARDPMHPGANHYYVHAIEASPHPERALPAAERLQGMMPGAGHLEHMPAHILQRVGRYVDAAAANRSGISADLAYMRKARPLDYYGIYTAHNYQFLAYSALMAGRSEEALQAAHQLRLVMNEQILESSPGYDWYAAQSYAVQLRFRQWSALLDEREPKASLIGLHAGYLHGRGSALAATGDATAAKAVLALLEEDAKRVPADYGAGLNRLSDVLRVAVPDLRARIAAAEGNLDEAIVQFRAAVAFEDALAYDEPRAWFISERQMLGTALLKAGQAAAAAAAFREDLVRNPENGWSLFGLRAALTQVQDSENAVKAGHRFDAAWRHADFQLSISRADGEL